MKAIDVQVQTFTHEAMKFHADLDEIELMTRNVFKRDSAFTGEAEFIAGLRAAGVRAMMRAVPLCAAGALPCATSCQEWAGVPMA